MQKAVKMIKENLEFLRRHDPEIADAIKAEFSRQQNGIELIASEDRKSVV